MAYNTAQRKILTEFLKMNPDRQFSAKEIYEGISNDSISLSAVYRNIAAMESDGVVNRFSKEGSREIRYQYVNAEECKNCIHLTCVKCGTTFHMNSEETEKIIRSLKETDGFEINKSKTVLYGSCKECAEVK